jgi:hypothetical protein
MVETDGLDGSELDTAVARAEIASGALDVRLSDAGRPTIAVDSGRWESFRPSVSWAHGGPIIENQQICLAYTKGHWAAFLHRSPDHIVRGRTPLIAAMRAYVA